MSSVDRISHLPDEIIHHILSFLPTTNLRARTSLLSKRWRYIWTHHPSLHLSAPLTKADANVASLKYVRSILGCLRSCNAPVLHQVYVDLWLPSPCTPDEAELHADASDMLLRFAGFHSVRQLRVQTLSHPSIEVYPMIPVSLFDCDSIADLIVIYGTFPNAPRDFHGFRYLKSLYLSYGSIDNDTLGDLLVCCPILESLGVVGCTGPTDIDVSPWNLPKLTDLTQFACEDWIGARIEAPNLRSITYEGDLQCLNLKNSSSLLEAALRYEIETDFDTQDDLKRLLLMISTVNVLTANDWFYQFVIPKPAILKSLKELTLYIDDELSESMLNTLIINIGGCPMLEKLVINFSYVPRDYLTLDLDGNPPVLKFKDVLFKHLEEIHEQDECDPSELLGEPRCFLWNLKTVVLSDFLGSKNEMRMAKFLLGNAVALEEFVVFDFPERDEDELHELFAPIPRASSQVHLKLSELEKSALRDCFGKHCCMFI